MNDTYQQMAWIYPSYSHDQVLLARPADFIPTTPDLVVEIASKATVARFRVENEKKQRASEQNAEELFQKSPDFWPKHKAGPLPWVENDVGRLLISKRWKAASKDLLGTNGDIDSIRAVVLKHMANPDAQVSEIRWLSASVVMVSSGWYSGPTAAAGYTYVLEKSKDGWIVLAYYMNAVS
jgi:hypothetical protein